MNIDLLKKEFPYLEICDDKILIDNELSKLLFFLKNNYEFSFDILISIIAVDYLTHIELIYSLLSTKFNEKINVSINIIDSIESISTIFPSAYFDECEIYDLFGINFIGNKELKRLLMPKTWIGHPLRKTYELTDERLSWNG